MPRRRDFYCDFYCALRDQRCGPVTHRHAPVPRGRADASSGSGPTRAFTRLGEQRSGSSGLGTETPLPVSGDDLSHRGSSVPEPVVPGAR
jgi:hypothetical protein